MPKPLRFLLAATACAASLAAHSQTPTSACPPSIMAGGGPFDLAGAIRMAGSPEAVLAAFEQGQREMSANSPDCSAYANAEECKATKAVARDVISALKTCIAKAAMQAKNPPPAQTAAAPGQGGGSSAASLYDTHDNSDGNQLFRQMAATGTPFTPLNPQKNHTGEPCVYFTQPLVRPDGGGLNAYADGSYVAYGKFYYTCRDRRWVSIGLASSFVNVQEHAAERLERSTVSTQIYEKE